jgi:hypothetical protein
LSRGKTTDYTKKAGVRTTIIESSERAKEREKELAELNSKSKGLKKNN